MHMYDLLVGYMHNGDLNALMNGPIRKKLGIIPSHVTWGGIVSIELFSCFLFKLAVRPFHNEDAEVSCCLRSTTSNCDFDVKI